jgi:hypothetical protein
MLPPSSLAAAVVIELACVDEVGILLLLLLLLLDAG